MYFAKNVQGAKSLSACESKVNVPSKETVFVCSSAAITPALHAADPAKQLYNDDDDDDDDDDNNNNNNNNNNKHRAQYHSSGSASYLLLLLLPYSLKV